MGLLRHVDDARRVELLPTDCLVGRSRLCDLRLSAKDISSQHAALKWTGLLWELQDLGSRNGSFVDERRLAGGERVALRRGTRLRFARQLGSWELADEAAPSPMARNLVDGRVSVAERGLLAIPDAERPEVALHAGSGRGWLLERGGETTDIGDRAVLLIGNEEWRVYLPSDISGTLDEDGRGHRIGELRLRFAHSVNEEYIEVVALAGEQRLDLRARAHHYPLLVLARLRIADRLRGVPLAEEGWILQERFLDMLKIEAGHLNITIHRCRVQFGQAGIVDAARLVERRKGTRQLRLGVSELEIVAL